MNGNGYQEIISANIKSLRADSGMTQEHLADRLGVSFQAVSKWENEQSCPDISLLPAIADIFDVSVDKLFGREPERRNSLPWDDDGTVRGVVYVGQRLLNSTEDIDHFTFTITGEPLNVETRCNLTCYNLIRGDATAGGNLYCGVDEHGRTAPSRDGLGIGGSATAGNNMLFSGGVGGDAAAGNNITASGGIGGGAKAGSNINISGGIGGGAKAGDNINASGGIHGGVEAGNNVNTSGGINGDVHAGEKLTTSGSIIGNVECGGDIECREIKGDVHCEGDIYYKK